MVGDQIRAGGLQVRTDDDNNLIFEIEIDHAWVEIWRGNLTDLQNADVFKQFTPAQVQAAYDNTPANDPRRVMGLKFVMQQFRKKYDKAMLVFMAAILKTANDTILVSDSELVAALGYTLITQRNADNTGTYFRARLKQQVK